MLLGGEVFSGSLDEIPQMIVKADMARFANECSSIQEALNATNQPAVRETAICIDGFHSPQGLTSLVSRMSTTGVSRSRFKILSLVSSQLGNVQVDLGTI